MRGSIVCEWKNRIQTNHNNSIDNSEPQSLASIARLENIKTKGENERVMKREKKLNVEVKSNYITVGIYIK